MVCFDEWFDANAEEAGDSCMSHLWHATCTECDEGVWDQGSWCAHDEYDLFCCWWWGAWEGASTDVTPTAALRSPCSIDTLILYTH